MKLIRLVGLDRAKLAKLVTVDRARARNEGGRLSEEKTPLRSNLSSFYNLFVYGISSHMPPVDLSFKFKS